MQLISQIQQYIKNKIPFSTSKMHRCPYNKQLVSFALCAWWESCALDTPADLCAEVGKKKI